jgi:hypothetical protein
MLDPKPASIDVTKSAAIGLFASIPMCIFYSMTTTAEAMRQLFALARLNSNVEPLRYIWPTDVAPIVRLSNDGKRELASAQLLALGGVATAEPTNCYKLVALGSPVCPS